MMLFQISVIALRPKAQVDVDSRVLKVGKRAV